MVDRGCLSCTGAGPGMGIGNFLRFTCVFRPLARRPPWRHDEEVDDPPAAFRFAEPEADRERRLGGYGLTGRWLAGWLLGGAAVVCGSVTFAVDATGSWPGIGLASWLALVAGGGLGVVGALAVDHQPRNAAAWCLPTCGILLAGAGLLSAAAGAISPTDVGMAATRLLWCSVLLDSAATGGGALLLMLFPDGRPPSGATRWLWWLFMTSTILVILPGIAVAAGSLSGADLAVLSTDAGGSLALPRAVQALVFGLYGWWVVGAVLLLARLVRTEGEVRRQLSWAVLGLVGTAMVLLAGQFLVPWRIQVLAPLPTYLGILVAMRRHHLWNVRRLLRRVTVYASLSLCLAVLYSAVVLVLGLALSPLAHGSPVAVAVATLATAVAFTPLRRRLQSLVDRRFDQRTWRAVRTMRDFTEQLRLGDRSPADIEDTLRRVLDEPTLRVRYVGDAGRIIDINGAPSAIPVHEEREQRMVATGGHDIAVVDVPARFATERRPVIDAVLTAAALSLENAALHARVATQLAEVQASRARLVEAADTERRRIERDLHDGAQQRLVAVGLQLRMLQMRLRDRDPTESEQLGGAVDEVRRAVDELRELSRGMLPPVLAEEGLGVALRTLAARLPLPLVLDVPGDRFPGYVEATAWFVSCEGLTNAVKHARARELRVTVHRDGRWLRVEVRDDGEGGAAVTPAGGLQGLTDRVAAVGGRLTVESRAGSGTTIVAELPCAS